jgi:dihydroorotase
MPGVKSAPCQSRAGIAKVSLTLTRPDDWHLHVRDGDPLHTVVPHTAAQFGRAIIMPNLRPPVTTAAQAWPTAAHPGRRACRRGV